MKSLSSLLRLSVAVVAIAPLAVGQSQGLTPDQAEALRSAQALQREGRHTAAVAALEALRRERPDVPALPRLLSYSLFELDRPEEARAAAVDAIGLGRLTPDLLTRLVQIDRGRGDAAVVLDEVRILTILDPGNPTWRRYRAELLAASGRLPAAETAFRAILDDSPSDAEAWVGLGNSLVAGGSTGDAASAYETAWILGRRSPEIADRVAGLEQQSGDLASAVQWLERAEALSPDADGRRAMRSARLLASVGRDDEALETAARLADAEAPDVAADASLLCATIALRAGSLDEASARLEEARNRGVSGAALTDALGRSYFVRGDHALAARWLAEVADGDAGPDVFRLLARARIEAGELDLAREAIVSYVERRSLDDVARSLIAAYRSARAAAATDGDE
ncbi:MAG: tetratricopeptide repeat protein [Planctomycetota bacterium]